jgi:glycerate dehydrogenase
MKKVNTLVATIPGMIGDADLAPLRAKSEVRYCERESISEAELAEMCAGFDCLMLNMDVVPKQGSVKLTERFYDSPAVRRLKTIAIDMTGMDYFSPGAARSAGVQLQNIPHYSSRSVAESILAEVLLHSRQRHLAYQDVLLGAPVKARKGINLLGRTAGIVGYGSIGETIGELLAAVGMNVVVWNRSPKSTAKQIGLPELFDASDVICVCLKTVHSGEQRNVGVIDRALLSRCKGSIVVNLANELLVDANAMLVALNEGKVTGYSVEASPAYRQVLQSHPSVHFAPSNAWDSDESMATLRSVWVQNVISTIDGAPQNVYRE